MMKSGAAPVIPHHTFGPLRGFGPCPGEDRKSPGRTNTCGGADMSWMGPIYAFLRLLQGVYAPIITIVPWSVTLYSRLANSDGRRTQP